MVYLGDRLKNFLDSMGITEDRVSNWIGRPCGCKERIAKINSLHRWFKRFSPLKNTNAKEYLERIMDEDG